MPEMRAQTEGKMKHPVPKWRSANQSQMTGLSAQDLVYRLLRGNGLRVQQMPYNSPYDLLVNGERIEVKCGKPISSQVPTWIINFHRHNKLNEIDVDKYLVRLENVPYFKYAIHLLFDAPVKTRTIRISLRSLLAKYAINVIAFNTFVDHKQAGDGRKHRNGKHKVTLQQE